MNKIQKLLILIFVIFAHLDAHNNDDYPSYGFTISSFAYGIMQSDDQPKQPSQGQTHAHGSSFAVFEQNQSGSFPSYNNAQQLLCYSQAQAIFNATVAIDLGYKKVRILPQDLNLINKIVKDNFDKPQKNLSTKLACSSAFNYAQTFCKDDEPYKPFEDYPFINTAHFQQYPNAQDRIKQVTKAAQKGMVNRHDRERYALKTKHHHEKKVSKNESKSSKKNLKTKHNQENSALEKRHKTEQHHPLGIKKNPPKNAEQASSKKSAEKNQPTPKESIQHPCKNPQTSPTPPVTAAHATTISHATLAHYYDAYEQSTDYSINYPDHFDTIMQARATSLKQSFNTQASTKQHLISAQATGFLQAKNMNPTPFTTMQGVEIQHQLTDELISVVDAIATNYMSYQDDTIPANLSNYCIYLASLTQASNHEGFLDQTISGANCCHGITNYIDALTGKACDIYKTMQTSLHYFNEILESYGQVIVEHAAQGAIVACGLEAIITAGMAMAPTATYAAATVMIGATAYFLAPLCWQAAVNTTSFVGSCIAGNWGQVERDLTRFYNTMQDPKTMGIMAEFIAAAGVPTPQMNAAISQILSIRPVITSIQNKSGEMIESLYWMSNEALATVYQQGLELLETPTFRDFNLAYEKICGAHFFRITPQIEELLLPSFVDATEQLLTQSEKNLIHQFATQTEQAIGSSIINATKNSYPCSEQTLSYALAKTVTGQKMVEAITQGYEETIFTNIAKQYDKMLANELSSEIMQQFCICQEHSILAQTARTTFDAFHHQFANQYSGLPEFSADNPYLTLQIRHIFHPSLKPEFDPTNTIIEKFKLNGFHHDANLQLHKSGMYKLIDKVYGTNQCYKAKLDFGSNIIINDIKTFFPATWSQEKVVKTIFEASQNRIEEIIINNPSQKKFECQGPNNIIIDIIFDKKNTITSAYPSIKNFKK